MKMQETKVPKNWEIKKLGEVCEVINGKNQKKVLSPTGKYPIYGSSGIIGFATDFLCNEGTTIIGRKGTINSPIFVQTKFWNVDTAFGLSPIKHIENKFLFFFCVLFDFTSLDKSTTIPSLAKRDILEIEIPIPPLSEQQAIVQKIEELFSELDKSIENLKIAQQQIKTFRQSVLKSAFKGKLTSKKEDENLMMVAEPNLEYGKDKFPKGWRFTNLGEVLKVSSGKGIKVNQLKGGNYPVYGGNGINGFHDNFFLDEEKLIIGRVGVKCGVTHITRKKSWVTDNALIVEPLIEDFDLKFFKLKLGFENLNKLSVSTAQPVISGSKIYAYEIAFPSLNEQKSIVSEIESRFSVADKLEESINQSLLQAETLRQSILKRAFEGKLI